MDEAAKNGRPKKRARRSRTEWIEEVRRWRESGQSATEYAGDHGIHAGTLAGWASKVRDSMVAKPVDGRRRSMFVPVHVAAAASTPARAGADCGLVEVVLRNGRRIRISGTFDGDAVARLLMIAEGAAC